MHRALARGVRAVAAAACLVPLTATDDLPSPAPTPLSAAAESAIESALSAMAEAREAYLAALAKEQERAVARLAREQEQLTRAGRLEEALAVKARVDAIRAGELVKATERPKPEFARPADAVEFRGHHYALIDERLRWDDARLACEKAGGRLVCIADHEENVFIARLAPGVPIWIGCSDAASEGAWKWVDGSPVGFAAWLRRKPADGADRDWCSAVNGGWSDSEDRRLAFVCEWSD